MTTAPRLRARWVAVVLAGVLLAALTVGAVPAQAVHRGHDVAFDSYQFMVSLRLADTPDKPRCSGTLIAPDIVLTAGHCVGRVPQGEIVAVVGADIPDWSTAPRIATLGHRVPPTIDLPASNRDDIAVVRLAVPQSSPTVRLAAAEPGVGDRAVVAGFGCTNAPPVCEVMATRLQAASQTVLDEIASCGTDVFWTELYDAPRSICTKGTRRNATVNRGDSGGPLLVRDECGGFRQVGVTSLGSDSTVRLYAGFTSIPVAAEWIAEAIESLRNG